MLELLPTLTVKPFCNCCLLNPSLKCNLTYKMYSALFIFINKYFKGLFRDSIDVVAYFRISLQQSTGSSFSVVSIDGHTCASLSIRIVEVVNVSGLNSADADSKDISFSVSKF